MSYNINNRITFPIISTKAQLPLVRGGPFSFLPFSPIRQHENDIPKSHRKTNRRDHETAVDGDALALSLSGPATGLARLRIPPAYTGR